MSFQEIQSYFLSYIFYTIDYYTHAHFSLISLFNLCVSLSQKEHHDRASKVNKNMPYMGNSTGVQFTWGVPCNYLDFECYHDFRKKKYDLSAVPRDVLFAGEVEAAHH